MCGVTLLSTAVDAVGIFRKSGGKQRINHLKEMIEGDPGITVFHFSNSFLTITSTGCVLLRTRFSTQTSFGLFG